MTGINFRGASLSDKLLQGSLRKLVGCVMIDFRIAFDLVDQQIRLKNTYLYVQ